LALLAEFFDNYVSTKKDSSQTSKKDIPKEEPCEKRKKEKKNHATI